jgi:hypothetical protein
MRKIFEVPRIVIALNIISAVAGAAGVLLWITGEELPVGAGLIISAVLYLALSAIVESVARTAFHAERSADALEKTMRGSPAPPPLKKSRRFYVVFPGGEQRGPMEVEELQRLIDEGRLAMSVPVMREGEDEWRTLADFMG